MKETATVRSECKDCGGTGLYKGWCCHEGAAMVCQKCNGEGYIEIEYTPFTGRKKATGIKRVFQAAAWRHFYPRIHTFNDGNTVEFDKFGCTLEEWEAGKVPTPIPGYN